MGVINLNFVIFFGIFIETLAQVEYLLHAKRYK